MASPVKVEHINPFVNATKVTFETMVHTAATPGKIMLLSGSKLNYDISGIIGLSGGAKGTVAISFPRVTALKVVSEFIGEKQLALDETVKDASRRTGQYHRGRGEERSLPVQDQHLPADGDHRREPQGAGRQRGNAVIGAVR